MSQDSNFLKNTLDLLETDLEVKSYIYQQILDFNPFVTPDTLVMVIARDPKSGIESEDDTDDSEEYGEDFFESIGNDRDENAEPYNFRIAIILKDQHSSIEAEAFHDDIFTAIRLAKESLVQRLIEIQEEVENPGDRIKAIKEASEIKIVH